jgi:hypothetical protein
MRKHKDLVEKKRNNYKTIQQITGVRDVANGGCGVGACRTTPNFASVGKRRTAVKINYVGTF